MGDTDATAKTVNARAVALMDQQTVDQIHAMEANFGKTWLMGKVTAIDGTKITLTGTLDSAPHTIVADENTEFRKRRDPITLADIQVGDTVRADGAAKGWSLYRRQRERLWRPGRRDTFSPARPCATNSGQRAAPVNAFYSTDCSVHAPLAQGKRGLPQRAQFVAGVVRHIRERLWKPVQIHVFSERRDLCIPHRLDVSHIPRLQMIRGDGLDDDDKMRIGWAIGPPLNHAPRRPQREYLLAVGRHRKVRPNTRSDISWSRTNIWLSPLLHACCRSQ